MPLSSKKGAIPAPFFITHLLMSGLLMVSLFNANRLSTCQWLGRFWLQTDISQL